jgi:hypothetical protein
MPASLTSMLSGGLAIPHEVNEHNSMQLIVESTHRSSLQSSTSQANSCTTPRHRHVSSSLPAIPRPPAIQLSSTEFESNRIESNRFESNRIHSSCGARARAYVHALCSVSLCVRAWNLAAADVPQVALILATCEKSLRCSSLLQCTRTTKRNGRLTTASSACQTERDIETAKPRHCVLALCSAAAVGL